MHIVRVDVIPFAQVWGQPLFSVYSVSFQRICVFTNITPVYITRSDCMFFALPYTLVQRETWRTSPVCTQSGHRVTDSEAFSPLTEEVLECFWSHTARGNPVLSAPFRPGKQKGPLNLKWEPAIILYPQPCVVVFLSTTCMHLCSCLQFISWLDSKNSVPLPHQVYCSRHTINIDWTVKLINTWLNEWMNAWFEIPAPSVLTKNLR